MHHFKDIDQYISGGAATNVQYALFFVERNRFEKEKKTDLKWCFSWYILY